MTAQRALRSTLLCAALCSCTAPAEVEPSAEVGSDQQAIIGGDLVTDIEQYPGLGALIVTDPATNLPQFFCGGTLIAPDWLVTAAHCFTKGTSGNALEGGAACLESPQNCRVTFGGTNWRDVYDGVTGTFSLFQKVYLHEGYNPDTLLNDVALVKLGTVPPNVEPAAIMQSSHVGALEPHTAEINGDSLVAVGWGAYHTEGAQLVPGQYFDTFDADLREANLMEYAGDHLRCRTRAVSDYVSPFLPMQTHFCAGAFDSGDHDPASGQNLAPNYPILPEVAQGTCRGDSGSPVYRTLHDEQKNVIAGIVSSSVGCALDRYPAWITRLGDFVANFRVANQAPFRLPQPIPVQTTVDLPTTPSDLVLVLDRSGSMSEQDYAGEGNDITRLEMAAAGARMLISRLDPADDPRVAIVTYSSTATAVLPFTRLDGPGQAQVDQVLLDLIQNVGPSGMTSIGAGLNTALQQLATASNRQGRRAAIFLLTDGRQNTAPCLGIDQASGSPHTGDCSPPSNTSTDIILDTDGRLKGIPLCSIGLGRGEGQVDERILEQFSTRYLDATSSIADRLPGLSTFGKCAPEFTREGIAIDPVGVLQPAEVAEAPYVYDAVDDSKLTFLTSWSARTDNIGDVRLLVNRPDGSLLRSQDATEGRLDELFHVQRDRAPQNGRWRAQVVRKTHRFVNAFTTDSFRTPAQGVALVRREIQRLCADGCARVLYYEDGRVNPSRASVYAEALAAEGPNGTGLIGSIGPSNPADAAAFRDALQNEEYALVVYAHQRSDNAEPYDDALANVLCASTTPAIITDTRVVRNVASSSNAAIFHYCAGAVVSPQAGNYTGLEKQLGTLLDQDVELVNPGYAVHAYSVAPIPFDAVAEQQDSVLSVGATQLEGSHTLAFSQTENALPFFFGSIVSLSADRSPNYQQTEEFYDGPRKLQRWASEVHVRGLAHLSPLKTPAQLGGGLTLSVSADRMAPPNGYTSATVWAEVTYPTVGLDTLLGASACTGSTTPAGDLIPGGGRSIVADQVPSATQRYDLNDRGVSGDATAADRVWSLRVAQLGQVTGTYKIRYFAEFEYVDANGQRKKLHREEIATQYVGAEVRAGSAVCPQPAPTNVTFVDRNATGARTGASWENAYTSIQAAVDVAEPGSEVWVKEGTYAEGVLELKEHVRVFGGFDRALTGTAGDVANRNLAADVSVLDGLFRYAIADMADDSHLDGFTLRNGYVITGGVVFADAVRASIANCKFENNSILQAGALLYAVDASLSVQNSSFRGNSLLGTGAAAYNVNSTASFANCTFVGPAVPTGALIQNHWSDVRITHSTFAGGVANLFSAIDNWDGPLRVDNSILWTNTAPFWRQIANYGSGPVTVTYSDVRGGHPGTGNINASPLFVSDASDLRLRSGSPCLDAANSAIGPRSDIAGLARVDDPSRVNTGVGQIKYADMGAHERQP